MSVNQDGLGRGNVPRRTTRRTTATPVRDISPGAHSAYAASTAIQSTPAARRSTRASSRRPDQPNGKTLPEIQTRQSYAYGSSKTPLLPEQLHVRDKMTIKQVTDQMETAINRAEQNLDTHVEVDVEGGQQAHPSKSQAGQHNSRNTSPPASVTTELQKKQRTAAWASSLENDQLDDIPEEDQPQLDSPETRRTEPSSFPSGLFDQSYQYERGLRPPRKPPSSKKKSLGSQLGAYLDYLILSLRPLQQTITSMIHSAGNWLSRLGSRILKTLFELPDSRIIYVLVVAFVAALLSGLITYVLCFGYTRVLCNPASSSKMSQTIESWCGVCQSGRSVIGMPLISGDDKQKLRAALQHIDNSLRSIESRLNSRLDEKVSAISADISDLRGEQSNLVQQLEHVSNQAQDRSAASDVASPLLSKINYFSPANGAIVNAQITSPTRQSPVAMPLRVLARMIGIQKYNARNPVTALEPWQDVGDCWCAAATVPGQDSVRLGVSVREYIYPTELVLEHPPKEVSLTPETAPKRVELWADFGHLTQTEWKELGLDTMTKDQGAQINPFGKSYGLVASVEYELASHASHLQRFILDVNQYGDLKYSAQDFVVRVRSTYGGYSGCLYRVRLHGTPVVSQTNLTGSHLTKAEDTTEQEEVVT